MDSNPVTLGECATCGSRLTGPFCSNCGQRALDKRHTLWGLIRGAAVRLFDLEQGLLNTVMRLSLEPGRVVRDYLAGRTVPYTHPLAYLVLAFAAFAAAWSLSGGTGGDNRLFMALIVLFIAAGSRLVFLRREFNYAEHLILNMYLFAHAVLLLTVAQLAVMILPAPAAGTLFVIAIASGCAYVVWGYSRFFVRRPWLGAAGGLLSLALGIPLWLFSVAVLLNFIRGL